MNMFLKRVWVVMGNDFPDAVFDNPGAAEAHIVQKKDEAAVKGHGQRVYWRACEFEVRS